jgi:hypothetical protein
MDESSRRVTPTPSGGDVVDRTGDARRVSQPVKENPRPKPAERKGASRKRATERPWAPEWPDDLARASLPPPPLLCYLPPVCGSALHPRSARNAVKPASVTLGVLPEPAGRGRVTPSFGRNPPPGDNDRPASPSGETPGPRSTPPPACCSHRRRRTKTATHRTGTTDRATSGRRGQSATTPPQPALRPVRRRSPVS